MHDDVPVFNVFPDTLEEAVRRLVAGAHSMRSPQLLGRTRSVLKAIERGDSQAAALTMFHATTLYEALTHGPMAVKSLRSAAQRRRAAPLGGKAKSLRIAQRNRDLIKGARDYRDAHPGSKVAEVADYLEGWPGIKLANRTICDLIGPTLRG